MNEDDLQQKFWKYVYVKSATAPGNITCALYYKNLFYGSYLRFWNKKQKEIINETSYSTCAKMCKKLKFNVCE